VQPPQGNLAARVSISPKAQLMALHTHQRRIPATVQEERGGNQHQRRQSLRQRVDGGAKMSAPVRKLMTRPEPKAESEDVAERTGPPDFAALRPAQKPEAVFAYKRVYTLNVNMPNLNSATGSWILKFSELHSDVDNMRHAPASAEISGPVPLQKVDPKYPPTLIKRARHRRSHSIRGHSPRRFGRQHSARARIDAQLDANAIRALRQWKIPSRRKTGNPGKSWKQ